MELSAHLPADLAALARPAEGGVMRPVTVRLDAASLDEVDRIAQSLNRADRAPLLRFVVRQGLAVVRDQLANA